MGYRRTPVTCRMMDRRYAYHGFSLSVAGQTTVISVYSKYTCEVLLIRPTVAVETNLISKIILSSSVAY